MGGDRVVSVTRDGVQRPLAVFQSDAIPLILSERFSACGTSKYQI
jgi:hypothetical protein